MNKQAVIEKCQEYVKLRLKAPATAQFAEINIIEEDSYGRVLLDVAVDAQNGFGALIRNKLWVLLFPDGDSYTVKDLIENVRPQTFLSSDTAIKKLNGWNKPL